MVLKICKNCGKNEEHQAHGLCYKCYKKNWQPKLITCKRCGRERPHHSRGYCKSCCNVLFNYEGIKKYNYRKWHNVDLETYRKVTKECVVCGFDKVVDLHHLDRNKQNNSQTNLIGLCPNHHRMIHMFDHQRELFKDLTEKGFEVPKSATKLP